MFELHYVMIELSNVRKKKRITKCDKSTVKFDVSIVECDNGTIKCVKKKREPQNVTKE